MKVTIDPAEIQGALARGEFFLEYMPTISLADGRCLGAESLIRWRRSTEVVAPSDFIPSLEKTPLGGLVTYWVIETVAAELGEWLKANRTAHIGINTPPEVLGRGALAYAATKSGLIEHASQLIFEITERGIPDFLGLQSINQRALLGAKVALDDVTLVGGSNLAVFARCDFDAIKLAKSLTDQIQPHSSIPEWIRSVGKLLDFSDLLVIAEGVETEYQFTTLRAANIHAAQGFYFSRPLSAEAFMAFYRDRHSGRASS